MARRDWSIDERWEEGRAAATQVLLNTWIETKERSKDATTRAARLHVIEKGLRLAVKSEPDVFTGRDQTELAELAYAAAANAVVDLWFGRS